MGEPANIRGGNVKSLCDGPSGLSLPTVSSGHDLVLSVPGGALVNRVAFDAGGRSFTVTLLRQP